MSDQQIILAVDDNGKFLGYIPKEKGHTGLGKRHLAIAVLLENSKGEILLQKRKHKIFDNIWDITGATHPLYKPHPCHSERSEESLTNVSPTYVGDPSLIAQDDKKCKLCGQSNIDESLEEATLRCLKEEWGIDSASPRLRGVKEVGVFNYFAQYGDYCENEHCYLMVGNYDGEVKLNPEMGYEYKWTHKQEFLKDIRENPKKYTPWAREAVTLQKLV